MSSDDRNIHDVDGDMTITGSIHLVLPELADLRPAQLKMVKGPGAPKTYDLLGDVQTFGRTSISNYIINSSAISRCHLKLSKVDGAFVASDMDSRNGIYLNGIRFNSAVLYEGDQIQIGDVVFVFREGGR